MVPQDVGTDYDSAGAVAATPRGHYSQATIHNGVVYVATQLGILPGSAEPVVGSIEEQMRIAFENVQHILQASGAT